MNKKNVLTVAFLARAPAAAAQELQQLPLPQAAALIESVPTRLCAPVFHAMIPWHAARVLESISADKAAAVIRELSFADGVTLFRLVAGEHRARLYDAMPTRYAHRLRNALEYPQHQVGAWVDPDVPRLNVTDAVGDAIRVLQAAESASHVFLESGNHGEFVGLISVREVLRSESSMALGQLAVADSAPISNRASLASLAFDERWDEFLHLPVVGRRGNLLGGLSRRTLRHAMHEQHVSVAKQRSLLSEVLSAFWASLAGILELARSGAARQPGPVDGGSGRG